jgi:Cu-processing system ATP-binding protein
MQLLGVTASLDRPLRHLSGGMRQRVNAALAFLFSPELLILDEPTAGLDPISSSVLKDTIRRDRDNGCTFIVTSHVLSELEEIADRVAFLLEGRIRFSGTTRELKQTTGQATLERAVAHLMQEKVMPFPAPAARAAS